MGWDVGKLRDLANGKIQLPGVPGGQVAVPPAAAASINAGMTTAGNWVAERATAAARAVAISQLPEKLDLAKSPALETFVEKGLSLMGAKGVSVDGKPDPKTLEELNKVLVAKGRPELASLSDFGKDDLKAFNDTLSEAKLADGKTPNQAAVNHLNTANQTFVNIQKDFPRAAPAPSTTPAYDPSSPGG